MKIGRTGVLVTTAIVPILLATPAGAAKAQQDGAGALATPAQNSTPASVGRRDVQDGEDIVVTAQKREQTLVDVPQSVSVVSGETLERQQANDFSDYLKNVPNLQLVQGTPGQGRLVLRGVNTGGVASTVAVYLDETPFGSSSGLANGAELAGDFDTFDVARIEVLRGPQGTLYGASSLGGLLKFVTNAPDTGRLEARARASVEDTRGGAISYKGSAMINVPLGETLAFRASGSYRKQGGFIDSVGTAGSDLDRDINDLQSYGGRASLLWTPTSALSVRLNALLQDLKVDGSSVVEVDPMTLKPLYGGLTRSQYVPSFSDVRYRVYNALIDYDFGFATLTSSTSYSTQRQSRRDDQTPFLTTLVPLLVPALGLPVLPAADAYLSQRTNNRKWTQEVRLSSGPSGSLEWLVGGYYTNERAEIIQRYEVVSPGTLTPLAYPLLADVASPSRYEEVAGFGNATLHFGEHFDLDLGGRYSHNSQRARQVGVGPLAGPALVISPRSSDDVFTYSVAPKVKFGKHASLYARIAKGYRPGGPNIVPPGAPDTVPTTFAPDTVTSYEVGFKGETADRTAGIEAAIYHIDWSDIQLLAVVNNFGVNVNGTSADVDGAEVTATLRPAAGFVTSINAAYTDARLAGDTDAQTLGALKGDRLPFSPKYSVSVNADYAWSLGGDLEASIGGSIRSLSRQSGAYDPVYRARYGGFARIPAYEVVDLRAGIDFGRFGIEVYAKNVFDAVGLTSTPSLTSNGIPLNANGALATGVIRPRTIGVSLNAGF